MGNWSKGENDVVGDFCCECLNCAEKVEPYQLSIMDSSFTKDELMTKIRSMENSQDKKIKYKIFIQWILFQSTFCPIYWSDNS